MRQFAYSGRAVVGDQGGAGHGVVGAALAFHRSGQENPPRVPRVGQLVEVRHGRQKGT